MFAICDYDYISVLIWIRNSILLLQFADWSGFGSCGADENKLEDADWLQISIFSEWEQPGVSQK